MTDWATSGRRDSYRFAAVDPFSLMELWELDCVPGECSITYGYYTDNKAQATISILESSYPKALGNLVRVSHTIQLPGSEPEEEVLGTFFPEKAEKDGSQRIPTRKMNCYSTMWRLSKSALTADHVFRTGDYCFAGISRLMEGGGCTVVQGQGVDTGRTHTVDGRFAVGANRLESANEYAGWCDWQVTVDDYGRQVVSGYVPPANRSPKMAFEAGANCVYLPKLKETGTGELYNEVVAIWSRESDPGDGFGLCDSAYAKLPIDNPMAYERCGMKLTGVLNLREPCSHADLQAKADAYLAEHDAAIRYIEIEHVGIPHLRAGDTVLYSNPETGDANLLCEITQMGINGLSPLCLTKTKLKVVGA